MIEYHYDQLTRDIRYSEWQPFFALWPRTTICQSRVWGRCYRRRVWVYQGLELWPLSWQYGTVFDLLSQHD